MTMRDVVLPTYCFICLAATCAFLIQARAQETNGSAVSAKSVGVARKCSANPVLTQNAKKTPKSKGAPLPEAAPSCLEVKGEAIEVQEFLQGLGREQGWHIGDNHASEGVWTYVRYFGPSELDNYASTSDLKGSVKFSSGRAAVNVRTSELADGYVRVQITAHFLGEGKSTDALGQPATQWPLNSTGLLEAELITALKTTYRPLE